MNLKNGVLICSVLALMFGTACGSEPEQKQGTTTNTPVKLDIKFSTTPSAVPQGKAVQLTTKIAQNGSPVLDAEVGMEVWREGDTQEQHEIVPATMAADGQYIAQKSFAKAGLHHVTVHVTTPDIHQMPTFDFQVQ